jgi:hypothetical protein
LKRRQGDEKIGKIAQILEKVAKTVLKSLIAKKAFTPKLNLKVQNNYIKPLLKPKIAATNSTLKLLFR